MKKLLFIVILLFTGCSTTSWQSSCWTDSIYQATTISVRDSVPVRIAIERTPTKGVNHAEAQVLIDGKWMTLSHSNGYVYVKSDKTRYEPYKYMTLKEALEHQIETFE